MYRFVKDTQGAGANKRLFVQATLENDPDNAYQEAGYSRTLPTTSRPLKSSLKKTGPPITTSLNEDTLPKNFRDSIKQHENGNYQTYRVNTDPYNGRIVHDGHQTHFEFDEASATALARPSHGGSQFPGDDSLMAIYTKKRLSTEVLGSSLESTKVSKKNENGTRRITTRIVRKVTTLSRGEEKSVPHDLTRRATGREIRDSSQYTRNAELKAIQPKRVKVMLTQ